MFRCGVFLLLIAVAINLSAGTFTGAAIGLESSIIQPLFFVFLIGGIALIFTATKAPGKLEVEVYEESRGRGERKKEAYIMTDPAFYFPEYHGSLHLSQLRKGIREANELGIGDELLEDLKATYAKSLRKALRDPNRAPIAEEFLRELNSYEESDEEEADLDTRELKAAFKEWTGTPTKNQKRALSKQDLSYTPSSGTGYSRIKNNDTGEFVTVSSTPSSKNAGRNVFSDLVKLLQRVRKKQRD
tara:strand:+ start:139 stop:870 length:732 start_codon:yes stop_codon:yes gene_type:complete